MTPGAQAAEALGVAVRSVESLRKRFVEEGLDAALERKKQIRPSIEWMFDGEKEAKLIAIACGAKPAGRVKLDFAKQMNELVEVHCPDGAKITPVMDNRDTHRWSCRDEAFAPTEARRLIEKVEVVHTPKHGSWLNMAEWEPSVLETQRLGERIADQATRRAPIQMWHGDRNRRPKKID